MCAFQSICPAKARVYNIVSFVVGSIPRCSIKSSIANQTTTGRTKRELSVVIDWTHHHGLDTIPVNIMDSCKPGEYGSYDVQIECVRCTRRCLNETNMVVGAAGDVSCANGGLGISPSPTNPKCLPESHLEAHLSMWGTSSRVEPTISSTTFQIT